MKIQAPSLTVRTAAFSALSTLVLVSAACSSKPGMISTQATIGASIGAGSDKPAKPASTGPVVAAVPPEVKANTPVSTVDFRDGGAGEAGASSPNAPKIARTRSGALADAVADEARNTTQDARRPRLIGLLGNELIRQGPESAGQFDGSENVRQVSFATEGSTFDPDIDATGMWMVFSSTRHRPTSDLYIKSVHGTSITQLTSDPAHDIMPAFSPGGDMIAFASDRAGNWNIYVKPIDGGQPTQITSDNDDELHPTWSADGTKLAYCKFGSQTWRWEIWVVDINNPSTPSFLTYGVFPDWSPDIASNKILFQRAREQGSRYHSVWTIDYVYGEARRPTEVVSAGNAALINPSWSPDGKKIVFVTVLDPNDRFTDYPDQSDVWVVDLNGRNRVNLTNGMFANYQPVWSPAGEIFFVSDRSGTENVWAVSTVISDQMHGGSGVAGVTGPSMYPGGEP